MQTQVEPTVMTCLAENCAYNCSDECCAPAIVIGKNHPKCDTFTIGEVTIAKIPAAVRDCLVADCHFNDEQSCSATGVTLKTHWGHAACATFRQ